MRKLPSYALVLLLLPMFLAGCLGGATGPVGSGDLVGFVYISDGSQIPALSADGPPPNYRALTDAEVEIRRAGYSPRTDETGSDGGFEFSRVPAGNWRLTVSSTQLLEDFDYGTVRIAADETTMLDGPKAIKTGQGYYLIVGLDNYQYLTNRAGGVANANLFSNVMNPDLNDHDLAGMVRNLRNNDSQYPATYSAISNSIYDTIEEAQEGDHFVIYLSGYYGGGGVDADYFIPYDGNDLTGSRAITDGLLEDWLEMAHFQGTHVAVILDFPRSGYFIDGVRTDESWFQGQALEGHPRTTVITSGRGPSNIRDDLGGTSAFTYFLTQGLRGPNFPADLNNDGIITSDELFNYVKGRVANYNIQKNIPAGERSEPTRYQDTNTVILRYR